ncbi:hypothetical protein B0H16DRAFT_1537510 [Mycena metata]|uniref:Uncharacterized protein n=1 Tax=Mycena metata TaxID=1033252 RepID=A0AAD7J6W1_9AGAR|nr:hypothetical protein B0H16DRAFT_1537510 [Mycena metata]
MSSSDGPYRYIDLQRQSEVTLQGYGSSRRPRILQFVVISGSKVHSKPRPLCINLIIHRPLGTHNPLFGVQRLFQIAVFNHIALPLQPVLHAEEHHLFAPPEHRVARRLVLSRRMRGCGNIALERKSHRVVDRAGLESVLLSGVDDERPDVGVPSLGDDHAPWFPGLAGVVVGEDVRQGGEIRWAVGVGFQFPRVPSLHNRPEGFGVADCVQGSDVGGGGDGVMEALVAEVNSDTVRVDANSTVEGAAAEEGARMVDADTGWKIFRIGCHVHRHGLFDQRWVVFVPRLEPRLIGFELRVRRVKTVSLR